MIFLPGFSKKLNIDMIVQPIERIEDYAELVKEVQGLIDRVTFKSNQIICQGRSTDSEDWHLGIGSINDLEHKDEDSYINIFPSLNGTLIEKYIKRYGGFRSRIMNVVPHHCYTVHRDPTPRVHIPIVTNRDCWMVWPYSSTVQHLPVGKSYWTDTRKHHSFFNGGLGNRIHLVICVSTLDPANAVVNA